MWEITQPRHYAKVVFTEPITSFSYSNDMFIIPEKEKLTCLTLFDGRRSEIVTGRNIRCVHAVSYGDENFCIATPSESKGSVQLTWFNSKNPSKEYKTVHIGGAHQSSISQLALDYLGTTLATCSEDVSENYR